MVQNKGLIFKAVPEDWPVAGEHLTIEDRPIDLDNTSPPSGGLLTKNFYASFDPYQRGRMRPADVKSYSPPFELGKPVTNSAVSKVLKSDSSRFSEGDLIIIIGACPTEEYSLLPSQVVENQRAVRKLDNPYKIDPATFIGALGMPGLTAYSSFYEIGKPKKGEVIFISSASGAVGQIVGQLAKHEGLTVFGSVGDDKKLEYITKDLGFDGGFNYKKEKPADALKRLAPDGINIYYENVGGEQLEAAINAMQNFGRIIACGMISQYNLKPADGYPIRNMMQFVAKRINMQGFIVGDENMGPKHAAEHQKNVQKWIHEGTFKAKMAVTEGIDNAADGLIGMLAGKNFGKAVLKIAEMDSVYTASSAFFEALCEAGISHCFVNLGSDHPAIVEAIVKGQREKLKLPRILTCPNEMVALAMADGYARLTGEPQAVLVHVDVGTQGLAAAVHDASTGRCPVFIFAGLSPFTIEGELRGSRTEYIHWIQDIPDQKAILAQYCRYAGEFKTGRNIKQLVNRALSFAKSDPKGPVYMLGAREVMEEEIDEYALQQEYWDPVEPAALPASGVRRIAEALAEAREPLVITGYSGRNHAAVGALVGLADAVRGLRVLDTGGSDMCFPADHPAWLGVRYGVDDSIKTADVILVLDCDVPWINTQCHPRRDARIFHVDVDPLKNLMPVFYINALARYRADSFTAVSQLNEYLARPALRETLSGQGFEDRWTALRESHRTRVANIGEQGAVVGDDGSFGCSHLMAKVRAACPKNTIWVIEAVTSTAFVADQIQPTIPGSYINCGGGGLGWSGGAAMGIKLAADKGEFPQFKVDGDKPAFVCQVVGDGTYLFSVPSSVYWISARYNIPILTIVLNNKGWNAPRKSALLVHPDGYASKATNEELHISFAPTPDYAGIAKAAAGGRIWAEHASTAEDLERLLPLAVQSVLDGTTAVVDAHLDGPQGKYVGFNAASSS